MKHTAYVAGVGTTPFGKHADLSLTALSGQAISAACADAGLEPSTLQAAWFANVAGGTLTGQVCVTGQVALRALGIGRIPVVNVKNACASASTAFHEACAFVTAGAHDVVLAVGVEKLFHDDRQRTLAAFAGCLDVENADNVVADLNRRREAAGLPPSSDQGHSIFMQIYAAVVGQHMARFGTTREQFATIAAKNSRHGAHNPNAQFRATQTVAEVLEAREIVEPLTLPMCSPIGDGAAAAIIVSDSYRRQHRLQRCVPVLATALVSGWDHEFGEPDIVALAADAALRDAGAAPADVDVAEVHDATAPSELMHTESLGFCAPGDGGLLAETGATEIGGTIPVNPSGGLLRRGHPIGATGLAQIHELVCQLRGEASGRQVAGASLALAENSGGYLAGDAAAAVVSLIGRTLQ